MSDLGLRQIIVPLSFIDVCVVYSRTSEGQTVHGDCTAPPKTVFKVWCELWHDEQYKTCYLIMCSIGKVGMRGLTLC